MNHGGTPSESKFSLSKRAWRDGLAVQRHSALSEDCVQFPAPMSRSSQLPVAPAS